MLREGVRVYYYRTYYKAVRGGGGGEWRTCAMRDESCVNRKSVRPIFLLNFRQLTFGLWTLECVLRGNVGIHRVPKAIQVDGSRPRRVSLPGFPRSSLSGTLASYGASN